MHLAQIILQTVLSIYEMQELRYVTYLFKFMLNMMNVLTPYFFYDAYSNV